MVVVFFALLGGVLLQIFIADGGWHFFRFAENIGKVELLGCFLWTLSSELTNVVLLTHAVLFEQLEEGHPTCKSIKLYPQN